MRQQGIELLRARGRHRAAIACAILILHAFALWLLANSGRVRTPSGDTVETVQLRIS
jgi:hypothetical protein